MAWELVTTQSGRKNVYTGQTIFTTTPDASNARLYRLHVSVGSVVRPLAGVSGSYQFDVAIGGVQFFPPHVVTLDQGQSSVNIEYFVPANNALLVAIKGANASETDVDVTAALYKESNASEAAVTTVDTVVDGIATSVATIDDYLDTEIAAIKAKTDLIGTGVIGGSSPVSDTGTIAEIIIGDDYLAANGRAFEWTVTKPPGVIIATASATFGGKLDDDNYWLVTGTITDGASTITLSFDLGKADTADLLAGEYFWSAQVVSASGVEITKVKSGSRLTKLVYKQT